MLNTDEAKEQIKKSVAIIDMVHEHVKPNDEYPAGTQEAQMDTLLEQIDAVLYAAEKLKEINDFIDEKYMKEVMDFYNDK